MILRVTPEAAAALCQLVQTKAQECGPGEHVVVNGRGGSDEPATAFAVGVSNGFVIRDERVIQPIVRGWGVIP